MKAYSHVVVSTDKMAEAPKLETGMRRQSRLLCGGRQDTSPPASRSPGPVHTPGPLLSAGPSVGLRAVFTAAKGPASLLHGWVVLSTAGRPHSAAASASVSTGPAGPCVRPAGSRSQGQRAGRWCPRVTGSQFQWGRRTVLDTAGGAGCTTVERTQRP